MKKTSMSLMFYLGGHNNLAENVRRISHTLVTEAASLPYSIAVQWDCGRGPGGEAARFLSHSGKSEHEFLGALDSSSPHALLDFLQWAGARITAEFSLLFIFGHSDGFLGLLEDEESKGEMTLPRFAGALGDAKRRCGRGLDAIIFDCCWMGMAEILCELQGFSDYVLASQEEILGDGLSMRSLFRELRRLPRNPDRAQLLRALMNAVFREPVFEREGYAPLFMPSFSLLSMRYSDALKSALDSLGSLIAGLGDAEALHIRNLRVKVHHSGNFGYQEEPYLSFVDIGDLCSRIVSEDALPLPVRKAACDAAVVLEDVVVGHGRWGMKTANTHGLSLFFPTSASVLEEYSAYAELRWTREGRWRDAVERICRLR